MTSNMETTDPCTATVRHMNRAAIASLEVGKYHECLQALRGALQGIKESLSAGSEGETRRETSRHYLHSPSRSIILQDRPVIDDGAFEFFNCALVFSNQSDWVDEYVVPATLLYNMGLCHHQEALRQGNSSNGLKLAYTSYSHALTMLNVVSDELRDTDMLLVAALANNMANISSLFFDVENVCMFRNILEDVMETTDMDDFEDDDAYTFFSMNLMFVSELQWHALAPAA